MADGYGAVTGVGFLHEQAGHGLAYDVAASQYYGFLAAGLDIVALKQFHDAVGCGRYEAGQTDAHAAHVDGVETVNVLAVVNSLDYVLLVDVLGQGELDDESVYVGIVVEFGNLCQKYILGDVTLKADEG